MSFETTKCSSCGRGILERTADYTGGICRICEKDLYKPDELAARLAGGGRVTPHFEAFVEQVAAWFSMPQYPGRECGHPYFRWLLRIAAWDGLLPICVAFAPLVVKIVFPGLRGAVEITAIVLPISAFVVRAAIGRRHFAANRRVGIVRKLQAAVFAIAIFLLVLIECFLILSHIMPAGALFAANEDRMVWGVLFSLYLGSMGFALFPGPNGDTRDS